MLIARAHACAAPGPSCGSAYLRGSAFAEFEEGGKGTIAAGKLVGIAVLSQDIFTAPVEALPATENILTLVGGKIVYDAQALKGSSF